MNTSVPQELGHLADADFFEQVSKGIAYIKESAENLESAARQLDKHGNLQGRDILSGIAEEEVGKALILLDAARCPNKNERTRTLRRFRDHLAKGIYVKSVYWSTQNFAQVREYVNDNRQSLYLDGPTGFNWILPNSIPSNRESTMYVDYVRDITVDRGERSWTKPRSRVIHSLQYVTPGSIRFLRAIVATGATTQKGLRVVNDVWRDFAIVDSTTDLEIYLKNEETLQRLSGQDLLCDADEGDLHWFLDRWKAPMWSLCMKRIVVGIEDLRSKRRQAIEWHKDQASKRDPAPTISKDKVILLSDLFAAYRREHNEEDRTQWEPIRDSSLFLGSSFVGETVLAPKSLGELCQHFAGLTREERVDLVALAWFSRDTGDSWTDLHKQAAETIGNSFGYEIGLGNKWLEGYLKWEGPPVEWW